MDQDLRYESTNTLRDRGNKLAEQIGGCIEVRFRALMQRERQELVEEIQKREKELAKWERPTT